MSDGPRHETPDERFAGVDRDVLWTALAHAHDSIIVYERPLAAAKPRIVYVNEATIRQSGFSREELLSGSTGTGPLTDVAMVRALRDAMLDGEPMRLRLALYRKDGSMYWGEVDGRPVRNAAGAVTHWISIERDITESVERERALSALLDSTRSLFAVLETDALDDAFIDALSTVLNAEARFATDLAEPVAALALASDAVARDGRGRLAVALRALGRDTRVAVLTRPDGRSPDALDATVLALLAQTYAAAARNAALFDEVNQQRAAVLELSRMKGDLITMLANDLNNPLTTIRGFAEFLGEGQTDRDEHTVATDAIIRASERLADLGKETLALARLEDSALVLNRAAVNYGALLAEIGIELSPAIDITTDDVISGTADAALIRGLFENVIGNAVKYAAPGSAVSVRAGTQDDTVLVEVRYRGDASASGATGAFQDPAADDAHNGTAHGAGLGLYFARLVAHRHGGTIALEASASAGTCVTVRIPVDPPFTVPRSVVLLERDEQAASYAEHVLRVAGYRVRAVHDLGAFEEALRSEGAAIAVVPEGGGDALTAARASGLRVIELRKPYLARDLLLELDSV